MHSYKIDKKYSKPVAYFSSEFAIHQPLKIYSGGLGFLAGSHMRSAYDLKQNLVGVGILWKRGYYDQIRKEDGSLGTDFRIKYNNFLKDTGVKVVVPFLDRKVTVKVWKLEADTFETAPIILLSTDTSENDAMLRTITDKLYDDDKITRLAQYMVLGIGGALALEALGFTPDIYHLNEAHPLPVAFWLLNKFKGDFAEVKKRLIFTTHTPEDAGNERSDFDMIKKTGFLAGVKPETIKHLWASDEETTFNHSLVALRMAKLSNAVSKIHGDVSRDMWKSAKDICEITHITNAQNKRYWADPILEKALQTNDDELLMSRKRELKKALFDEVADQTGKVLDPDALTIVWARRFAGYKRADLILADLKRFKKIVSNSKRPVQVIWAGKPYPLHWEAIDTFNDIHKTTLSIPNCTILVGYELRLSRLLKQGSDIWLNNPRYSREASGTSGMTAAMNASVNFSIGDGWVPEFAKDGENCFVIPHLDHNLPLEVQDKHDVDEMYKILEKKIVPMYYNKPKEWVKVVKQSMIDVAPAFDSDRMADEYYVKLYNAE
ncbi:MAG: alpha-glucan family phosphorylase [Saprospiraceae bacterium]|nr:alpha-glucan family phosphorylase [Saprospiraceae bacterium]